MNVKTKITPIKILRNLENFALELVFPSQCINCKKKGNVVCNECFKGIKSLSVQRCPCCENSITDSGKLCSTCKQIEYPIKNLLVAADYKDSLLPKLIHLYKYRFIEDLHESLGEILLKSLQKHEVKIPDIIIPIPLHSFRLRWRGFNQSELLAGHIGRNLTPGINIKINNELIKRIKYSPPQMKIKKYSERQKNISGAFQINQKLENEIKGKKILLVDDVCTTGSTLIECAKILKPFSPRSISAVVIARQS